MKISKAITTRYYPATNTLGAKIKATDSDFNSVTIPRESLDGDMDKAHRQAAQALADKMGWEGEMICGSLKGGYVFVFVNDQLEEEEDPEEALETAMDFIENLTPDGWK